jgi:hypothetical protein
MCADRNASDACHQALFLNGFFLQVCLSMPYLACALNMLAIAYTGLLQLSLDALLECCFLPLLLSICVVLQRQLAHNGPQQ